MYVLYRNLVSKTEEIKKLTNIYFGSGLFRHENDGTEYS